MGRLASHLEAGERYLALRLIGAVFTALGSLLFTGSFLLLAIGLYTLRPGGAEPLRLETLSFAGHPVGSLGALGRVGGAVWILWSLVLLMSGMQSVAVGALIRLSIHLEENTRVAAQCLVQLRSRTEPAERHTDPAFLS